MDWTDLLRLKIKELEKEHKDIMKRLETKVKQDCNNSQKISLIIQMDNIQATICTLYECIGRSKEVTK